MTDVLAGHRASGRATLTDDSQIAAAMRHVLSLTAVAARHTLRRVAIAEADRPLLVAQYAQRAVDALEARSGYPQLWTVTSTNPPLTARNLNDRLEIGLRAWSAAAARHLQYPVPSTDLVRNIANQGVHIAAVTHAVLAARPRHTESKTYGGTTTARDAPRRGRGPPGRRASLDRTDHRHASLPRLRHRFTQRIRCPHRGLQGGAGVSSADGGTRL